MKIYFLLLFSLSYLYSFGALSIEGVYQGKNLYVMNPMDDDGFGYCATEVTLNGKVIMDSSSLSVGAFEINLIGQNLVLGDPILIVIQHHEGCEPKILNQYPCISRNTCIVTSINISQDGLLTWSSVQEHGKLPFTVEQYRWNKWIAIGQVIGGGKLDTNFYQFQVTPHSGENKLRIAQSDPIQVKKTSNEVKLQTQIKKIRYKVNQETQSIDFSNETMYELFDVNGSIIKKGSGNSVDLSIIKKGTYYLNFDNENVSIKWKFKE